MPFSSLRQPQHTSSHRNEKRARRRARRRNPPTLP
eukprot:CAMPEP_0119279180 /NCGR_PEP_ID=MMETSP1329-20130426/20355_1 /TAXON_ID=114041 /ORGANISM="Genus nov. species nov., Strain RCC1024" /LENGTH=34 /DNA_ID= /DNA_START= /DNA_END= /DNA_ORIENTATION=